MGDGIKLQIKDMQEIEKIWSHPDLSYGSEHTYLNKSSGELKSVIKKTYFNLNFTRYGDRLEIDGSLHKLFNGGLHNANDFTVLDCINTIKRLCRQLGMNPQLCRVIGLEFGVNIICPIEVSSLVKWLRFYHRNQFIKYPKLVQCYFAGTDYFGVKAYNKTLQFPEYAKPNLFRFEGKTRQSKYLKSKGIETLNDLLNPSVYELLSRIIIAEWESVLVFDKRGKKGLRFCNTDFWLDIIEDKHRNTFLNAKKKYYKVLGQKGLHNLITAAIERKLNFLNQCADSTISEFENVTECLPDNFLKTTNSLVHIPTIVKVEKTLKEGLDNTHTCLVTGLDISVQKRESKFISTTGLEWYRIHNTATYEQLESKYLTPKMRTRSTAEQIYYIAHNIRNSATNGIHNRRRFEKRNYHPKQMQFNF